MSKAGVRIFRELDMRQPQHGYTFPIATYRPNTEWRRILRSFEQDGRSPACSHVIQLTPA